LPLEGCEYIMDQLGIDLYMTETLGEVVDSLVWQLLPIEINSVFGYLEGKNPIQRLPMEQRLNIRSMKTAPYWGRKRVSAR